MEECLLKAPQSKELKLLKVECLMGMGKHEEAYAMSSALIRHSQNNSKLLITRARCLYLMGNLDSAVKHLQVRDRGGRRTRRAAGRRGSTRSREGRCLRDALCLPLLPFPLPPSPTRQFPSRGKDATT